MQMENKTNPSISFKKDDESRSRFLFLFKKTVLRIRDGVENPVYMIRYSLFTCPWFSIKIHRIFLSDDDCMHDHPWSFISFILWGGYVEHRPALKGDQGYYEGKHEVVKKLYGAGSILWRKAPSIHKLEVFQTATTLVVTFKRTRQWGFYMPHQWVQWFEYIRSGAKCE